VAADYKSHTTRHQQTMGHKRKAEDIERDAEHAAKIALAIEGLADGMYTNNRQLPLLVLRKQLCAAD